MNAGGTPGNAGGTGRPTNELRGSMRSILEKGLPSLQDYATGQKGKPADTLKAIDLCARYGLGLNDKFDEDFLRELAAAVGQVLKPVEGGDELLDQIFDKWRPLIAKRL